MQRRRNAPVVLTSLAVVAAMVGLVAASVPLYNLFCRVTGYGGTTKVADHAAQATTRPITVRFDASKAKDLPWRFKPAQNSVETHLGEQVLAFYTATNQSDHAVVGTATFNVTPAKAGQYFNKVQCFCFTEQRLEPGQSVDMPVTFFVDPALALDETTDDVTTITLSYTFYPIHDRQGRS
ncbi:cytochrome c oxidase assembly protein [Magnetospirillum sp. 64-120]|uniref:cytochrome c oxidase assembly protein n=1 Tax=Magnetospirillum sp. 64-120 TaxID=1895778 RepID=UPI000ADB3C76|nr:cytochrome c oxidase assembly protein [Magnetospirillum sp. 64-120]